MGANETIEPGERMRPFFRTSERATRVHDGCLLLWSSGGLVAHAASAHCLDWDPRRMGLARRRQEPGRGEAAHPRMARGRRQSLADCDRRRRAAGGDRCRRGEPGRLSARNGRSRRQDANHLDGRRAAEVRLLQVDQPQLSGEMRVIRQAKVAGDSRQARHEGHAFPASTASNIRTARENTPLFTSIGSIRRSFAKKRASACARKTSGRSHARARMRFRTRTGTIGTRRRAWSTSRGAGSTRPRTVERKTRSFVSSIVSGKVFPPVRSPSA